MRTPCKASTSRAINYWMSSLYHKDIFISREEARGINRAGRLFLEGFARLSKLSLEVGVGRYTYIPECHMMWHLVDSMCAQAAHSEWVLNCMCESCSVDEDLIGRFCVITRSVSTRSRAQRALERYLTQTLLVWQRPD